MMLLTITLSQPATAAMPATDLGYLLHKNPARVQTFDLSFGKAHIFYPEASAERCTCALLLEIDPVGLVRDRRGSSGEGLMDQYVNDRPYVASSFLSVAIAQVFGSALSGSCRERPELVATELPLQASIAALPCRGGESLLRRLFEPLGYSVHVKGYPLDPAFPAWGDSPYFTVDLSSVCRLRDLLNHIYVLVPVLDHDKHYWVGSDEVEKLLSHGAGWLAAHPERELIAARYLKHRRALAREAIERLLADEPSADDAPEAQSDRPERLTSTEEAVERQIGLNEQRLATVARELHDSGARSVLDLGCGEGKLLSLLIEDRQFDRLTGLDVSLRALEIAKDRLSLEDLPEAQRRRVTLLHGSLTYRDARLADYDAAAVVEVIEHLDAFRLSTFERVLFEFARPVTVILTTPNAEYNARFERLSEGALRHPDHRFEWTRSEFESWAGRVAARFDYTVRFAPIGPVDPELGAPTQMGVFSR